MHISLPFPVSIGVTFAFLVFVIVAGVVLIGSRLLFGKSGALAIVLLGLSFIGVMRFARQSSFVQGPIVQLNSLAAPKIGVVTATPQVVSNPIPVGPALSQFQHIIRPGLGESKTSANYGTPAKVEEISNFGSLCPGWRLNPPHEGTLGAGYCKYVLTSQQFATTEEAEAELSNSLAVDIQEAFRVGHSPAIGWALTPEDIRASGLITEKVIETIPLKVGEFDTSVQRVSWLVEFNPETQQALLARWQPIEAQRRSKLILSALAAISGVMGVSAFALRRKPTLPAPVASQMA